MKLLLILSVAFLTLSAEKCGGKSAKKTTYKGKLETKALCMNYTLTVREGNIDTSLVNTSWTDETTGKTYTNAFALANPCDFPSTINEGDEFSFVIDTATIKNCPVCMAFYPTPSKKLSIKVVTP